jgi:hypothetical protein
MIISTEQFGELTLDSAFDWFEGSANWNGTTIRLVFPVDEETLDDKALESAQALWVDQVKWKQSIESFATEGLLGIKNDAWIEEDEAEVTAEEFVSRITLEMISVASEGDFEFWYNDGDLFFGHSIVVRGNLELGPIEVCTEG